MLVTTVDGVAVQVGFQHLVPTRTICWIKQKGSTQEEDILLSEASAYCSAKDNFSRAVGRKVALAKALGRFDKNFRKVMWEAYFNKQADDFIISWNSGAAEEANASAES